MIVKFKKWRCTVKVFSYENKRMAIKLLEENTGECIAVATVNVPEYPLTENLVILKTYSENEGIDKALIDAGIIGHEPIDKIKLQFVELPVYKLNVNF